jgi:dipeptidyl aminopeptidase/acylaminoacyl peptidase
MKHSNSNLLWLLFFSFLAACTPPTEPVSVTRPVTAVPATPIALATATTTPTVTLSPWVTVTPKASPTVPTPTPTPVHIQGWLANETTANAARINSGAYLFFARDADLWRARPDGSGIEQLTFGGLFQRDPNDDNLVFLHNPLVSPDGRFITFSNDFETLYLVDITGKQPVQPLSARSDEVAWSPDSQQLAYLDPQGTITVLDVATGVLTALANQPRFDVGNLVFAPDGRSLAYSCCFVWQDSTATGDIRVITLANGQEDTVGETWSSIGGGNPPLCWVSPNEVTTIDKIQADYPDDCTYPYNTVLTLSPDKTQKAFLALLNSNDNIYFRRLGVMDTTTDEVVWQRDFDVILRRAVWSLDGSLLFLHVAGEEFWQRNGISDDAIYALAADGSGELLLVLENAVLLDVIAAWGN